MENMAFNSNITISSRNAENRTQEDLDMLQRILFKGEELSGNHSVVREYEGKLANFFGVKHAVATSSGTAALHIALEAVDTKPEDEIIVPVTGAVMSAMPIIISKATPIFVDIEPNSFEINIKELEQKINCKTKAIISVPMWGYSTYSKQLDRISKKYNIPIIEDAAQAIGTKNGIKYEGTLGKVGCFSTHELKLISTGEGGFILTSDEKLAMKMKSFSKIGFCTIEKSFGCRKGLNYKLSPLSAGLGIQ